MPPSNEDATPSGRSFKSDPQLLAEMISDLEERSAHSRAWLLNSLSSYFQVPNAIEREPRAERSVAAPQRQPSPPPFSADRTPAIKEFMLQKRPTTDVERVACLAYYLTHHRGVQFFKAVEISELNVEAAQRRFSNPSFTIENAVKRGYLVQGGAGRKQLSASGEQFVALLPDREAAEATMTTQRRKRSSK